MELKRLVCIIEGGANLAEVVKWPSLAPAVADNPTEHKCLENGTQTDPAVSFVGVLGALVVLFFRGTVGDVHKVALTA
jgi:hypothetical protein